MNRDHLQILHFHLHPSIPIPVTSKESGLQVSRLNARQARNESIADAATPQSSRKDSLRLHSCLAEAYGGHEQLTEDELVVKRAYWGRYGGGERKC